MAKLKPILVTAGIVLGVLAVVKLVAPESVKSYFRI